MADTYYIRSWKNYQWTVQYMLNEWLPEDPIEDHVSYGNVGEWDDQGCWTRRPGHYVYICYSPNPYPKSIFGIREYQQKPGPNPSILKPGLGSHYRL